MVRLFFAVAVLALATSVRAGDWIDLSIYSYHFAGSVKLNQPCGAGEYNNCTPGIGWEHNFYRDLRTSLHVYANSHGHLSTDETVVYMPFKFDAYKLGVALGAVTGYKNNPLSPMPFGGFTLAYERGGLGWNAILIPASGGVLHLQRKWEWK